ncbi:FadR/GntR family transcriptional regulator [Rhodococcus sp. ACPA1]|uniref:FadR/GntR family transcriptional regulator n=1 Tax=Rhodococcus sp. ACPA1 TaxID=2028572 RepID=UPI000BB10F08|nr:GntR family transcriptional regulator [Rhodococcus sp. ACPA1]PBC51546.1 GntR family transcriptional regulator [Rhodococcus sp. ACPA1]
MAAADSLFAFQGSGPEPGSDGAAFTRVRTRRGFEYIMEQIRDAVASGKLTPGSRLPAEREMADIFGVSRQGVREALRGLEMSGLVESRPGVTGGVFIRSGDTRVVSRAVTDLVSLGALSAESLLEARVLLTSNVVRLAGMRATEGDFAKLESEIDAFEEHHSNSAAGSSRTFSITHFYSVLAEATHNEVLVMLMDSLTGIVQRRLNKVGPDPIADVAATRRRFIKLLRNGQVERAVEEMTQHLERVEERLLSAETQKSNNKDG